MDAAVHVTASKPAAAEAAPAAEPDEPPEDAAAEEEPAAKAKQARKPRKASAGAKRPAPGSVKLHDSVSGQPLSGARCNAVCFVLTAFEVPTWDISKSPADKHQ